MLAREAGAVGARLTGAGMGGCIVALCSETETDAVIGHLADRYYARRFSGDLDDVLFAAVPSEGASVGPLGESLGEP